MPRKKGKPFARADELKKRYNISLTPTAHEGLKRLVEEGNFESLSEVLEQLGRGELVLTEAQEGFKPTLADLIDVELKKVPGIEGLNNLTKATNISATRLLELGRGDKPSDTEISNLAQGLWKSEKENWDEDELLELVVLQFGDRVLPEMWNGEVPEGQSATDKPSNGDIPEKLRNKH